MPEFDRSILRWKSAVNGKLSFYLKLSYRRKFNSGVIYVIVPRLKFCGHKILCLQIPLHLLKFVLAQCLTLLLFRKWSWSRIVTSHCHSHGGHTKGVPQGRIQGGPRGPGPPLITKNEAPAPKFYKIEAPEWQF